MLSELEIAKALVPEAANGTSRVVFGTAAASAVSGTVSVTLDGTSTPVTLPCLAPVKAGSRVAILISGNLSIVLGTTSATPTAWTLITANTGFTSTAYYKRVGSIIYLKGKITKDSGNIANADLLVTLPSGAQPAQYSSMVSVGVSGSYTKLNIDTDGTIVANAPLSSTTYLRLDNITLFTE